MNLAPSTPVGFHRLLAALILCICTSATWSKGQSKPVEPPLSALRSLLETPEASVDLARVKVTVDHMIEPSVDVEKVLKKLDEMAADVQRGLRPNASKRETLDALRTYLYQPGSWNNNQPLRYDFDDPLGRAVRNKILATYIARRKGNCISMPILFLLLGEKLGLDVSAATAPEHLFVRFRDETGNVVNVEATSGGFKQDAGYRRDMSMTDQAVANGLYLRSLSKRETVAVMIQTLIESYGERNMPEHTIAVADLVLEFFPKDAQAMLFKGHAYAQIINREFREKYSSPGHIPVAERPRYIELRRENDMWYQKAEALGWRQPDQVQEARYMNTVQRAKSAQ